MRTRFTLTIAIVLLAIGVWFFSPAGLSFSQPRDAIANPTTPSVIPATTAASPSAPVAVTGAAPATRWDDPSWEAIGEILVGRTKGESVLTDAQIEAFLRTRGETARNLLAVWESTRKRKWLERALQLFPNDPSLLLSALGEVILKDSHPEMVERFKKAAPDNPLAWIFGAKLHFEAGRQREGLAEIREALSKPGFYTYSNERIDASHQLYLDAGIDRIGGEFLAIAQMPLDHLTAAMRTIRGMNELAKDPELPLEVRREIAELGYGMGRMFSSPEASRMFIGQLVGMSIESKALELAQSQEKNPLPIDPSARLAEIKKQKEEIPDLTEVPQKLMQSRDAALLAGYMQQLRTVGEREAMKWLRVQLK